MAVDLTFVSLVQTNKFPKKVRDSVDEVEGFSIVVGKSRLVSNVRRFDLMLEKVAFV